MEYSGYTSRVETGSLHLYNMDCMELLRQTPDKHYSLCIVDPPYGIGADRENLSMTKGLRKDGSKRIDKTWRRRDITVPKYKTANWDSSIPSEEYFDEIFRVSKNQIIWGGNYFPLPLTGGWIVWDKKMADGFSLSKGELAWTSCRNSLNIFRWLWAGYAKQEPEERFHPTQKPVALYRWLLHNYAKPGDKILDTHLGSGSIAIACHEKGFDLTGSELDADYFAAMQKRLANAMAQQVLL